MEKENIKQSFFKKCTFPFIMTIITFIIGCGFIWLCRGDPFKIKTIIIILGFLPAIIFFALLMINYYKCSTIKSKNVITVICATLTVLLLGYYISILFIGAFEEVANPITDVKYYKDKVKGNLLKVFPKEIPSNAENVIFNYTPSFPQTSINITLYYVDKSMTLDKFDKNYKSKAIWIGTNEEYKGELSIFSLFNDTPVEYENENDFIVYLIDGKCKSKKDDCNHQEFLVAGFNEKTNEVIYYSSLF